MTNSPQRRVVSVSLGTSKRNKRHEAEILGESFLIERIGTDGNKDAFRRMMADLDGNVDALGVGGIDIYLVIDDRRYAFKDVQKLISDVKTTPVVDGSGLKHTLERETIHELDKAGVVDFSKERVLIMSAVDRYGMGQALAEVCPNVVYGDLMFALGLPIRIRSYGLVRKLGRALLPIITRCPSNWFYPMGEKQEEFKPKFEWAFREADLICGDWHFIRRYAPMDLSGKTILTQTLRKDDFEMLKGRGVRRVITTTPVMGGETFATNVMEGVITAILRKQPDQITPDDILGVLKQLAWKPNVIDLSD